MQTYWAIVCMCVTQVLFLLFSRELTERFQSWSLASWSSFLASIICGLLISLPKATGAIPMMTSQISMIRKLKWELYHKLAAARKDQASSIMRILLLDSETLQLLLGKRRRGFPFSFLFSLCLPYECYHIMWSRSCEQVSGEAFLLSEGKFSGASRVQLCL